VLFPIREIRVIFLALRRDYGSFSLQFSNAFLQGAKPGDPAFQLFIFIKR
jgi:hypothetical protein